jgi:hypothetical protein
MTTKILLTVLVITFLSTDVFGQLEGFTYYGIADGVKVYTKRDDEGVLYLKFDNINSREKEGPIEVVWYERSSGKSCKSSGWYQFRPGVSGGFTGGAFFTCSCCVGDKNMASYDIRLNDVKYK